LDEQQSESILRFKQVDLEQNPFQVFSRISNRFDQAYILESAVGPQKLAEFSFIGFNASIAVSLENSKLEVKEGKNITRKNANPADIFAEIRKTIRKVSVENYLSRLVGGFVGYISYDAIRYWERLPKKKQDKQKFPDYEFGLFDEGLVFDHINQKTYYYHSSRDNFAELQEIIKKKQGVEPLATSEPKPNISKEKFESMVRKAKDYVEAGDILQVVLARKYDFEVKGDLLNFYKSLRKINPSPYMYFLKMGIRKIIGSSPEMLLRITGRQVETYPIAGTRPRLANKKENEKLTKELLTDKKENAEHVMLVDLARNDVGRVSMYGSVGVPELMRVHQFSHVQHIVSRVVGVLRPEFDVFDAARALFPAGTVSGAPKVRAMEIIDELEVSPRGPYAGAVGYFSKNGSADFAITIRTLVADGNRASIQAGAGIVADSKPEREYYETEAKAGALLTALKDASE
jgi:anthranilate synthase component 1